MITEMISFASSIKVLHPENHKDITNTLKCLKGLQISLRGTFEIIRYTFTFDDFKTELPVGVVGKGGGGGRLNYFLLREGGLLEGLGS